MMLSKNKIKLFNSLKQKKYRQKYNIFVAEGDKLVREMLLSSLVVQSLFCTSDWYDLNKRIVDSNSMEISEINQKDLHKISNFSTANKAVAWVEIPSFKLDPTWWSSGIHLFLDGIRDPGNMGTIIRIADWFGVKSVISSFDSVDFYNPKVVQATMGSIARMVHLSLDFAEFINLIKGKINIYGACIKGESIYECEFKFPAIFVIGNESQGISKSVEAFCNHQIQIPKSNDSQAESLNAAIATGIICAFANHRIKSEFV